MSDTGGQSQESFLVIAEQTGQMRAKGFEGGDQIAAVDQIEQKIHLMNCLGYLAGARMRAGLVQIGEGAVTDRYGDEASAVVLGADRKRIELQNKAVETFRQASGHYALLDAGFPEHEVRRTTDGLFSHFLKKYWLPGRHQDNHRYRRQLERDIDRLSADSETTVSLYNRVHDLRPHKEAEPEPPAEASPAERDRLDELDTAERIEAILADARAGFLPKTNDEKNQIMSWLDYLDNPEKPLGINNQLREVFVRAQHPDRRPGRPGTSLGVRYGVRAVESIAWEVGDYALEAHRRVRAVDRLRGRIDEDQRPSLSLFDEFCRPDTDEQHSTLEEMFDDDLLGLEAYVQYADILELLAKGRVKGLLRGPLMGTEDPPYRLRPRFSIEPGKRKTVLNQYTRPDVAEDYKAHIIQRLQTTSIGAVRRQVGDCLEDLRRQADFHDRRIAELAEFQDGPAKPVTDAVAVIRQRLDELDAVA